MPESITLSYDNLGDVLYISTIDHPRPTKNIEYTGGLVLRYDLQTHDPVGATVIDYKEYWQSHRLDLVMQLADFFHISTNEVIQMLDIIINN